MNKYVALKKLRQFYFLLMENKNKMLQIYNNNFPENEREFILT